MISPQFSQIIYYGTLEILGEDELKSILKKDDLAHWPINGISHNQLNQLESALIERFGLLSVSGLAWRIGESSFNKLRHEIDEIRLLGEIDQRIKPLSTRLKTGFSILKNLIGHHLGIKIDFIENGEDWWVIVDNEDLIGITNEINKNYLMGLMLEFLKWSDQGKDFHIQKVENVENDKTVKVCTIQIVNLD